MSIGIPSTPLVSDETPFVPRRFSVEEYHRLGQVGVLTEDDRVELLEGVITPKMMHNPPHDAAIACLDEAIRPLLPPGWLIRIQSSITTADSEPEPDLAVVRGKPRDYVSRHPHAEDLALVVEVADSSLARDRRKARLYARAGVPAYWIVNLVEGQIEAYWQPSSELDHPAYQGVAVLRRGERVSLTMPSMGAVEIFVDDVLP